MGCWNKATLLFDQAPSVVVGIVYLDEAQLDELRTSGIPNLRHVARNTSSTIISDSGVISHYFYPKVQSSAFATPFHEHFDYIAEALSHTRNLQFIKTRIGGPYFDLEKIWEEHTYYEFGDRSVEGTMSTMVEEPYVNHIPTVC